MEEERMTVSTGETSPHRRARIAGVFYLLNFVTGAFAAFAGGRAAVYGDAANLLAAAFYIAVTILFYFLFKPVQKSLSLLAALFSMAGCALSVLKIFNPPAIPLNPLVCFGIYCLLIGYLTFKSTFLPGLLGVLMALGGLGWLTFLWPGLAKSLSP